jgi:Mn-containing catalase
LKTAIMPDGVPIEIASEPREEFSPGLDAELLQMIHPTAEQELRKVDEPGKG